MINGMKLLLAGLIILSLAGTASVAYAADTSKGGQLQYVPLEPLSPNNTKPVNLASYLNTAYGVLLTLGALFAVGTFTVGGVVYMTADAAGAKSGAVERMKASLWGLLLLAASALILYTVNPCLLSFNLGNLGTNSACPSYGLSSSSNAGGGGEAPGGGLNGGGTGSNVPPPGSGAVTNGYAN